MTDPGRIRTSNPSISVERPKGAASRQLNALSIGPQSPYHNKENWNILKLFWRFESSQGRYYPFQMEDCGVGRGNQSVEHMIRSSPLPEPLAAKATRDDPETLLWRLQDFHVLKSSSENPATLIVKCSTNWAIAGLSLHHAISFLTCYLVISAFIHLFDMPIRRDSYL